MFTSGINFEHIKILYLFCILINFIGKIKILGYIWLIINFTDILKKSVWVIVSGFSQSYKFVTNIIRLKIEK